MCDEVDNSTSNIPFLGWLFASHDEWRIAYTTYVGSIGFNVRMASTKMVDDIMVGC